MLLTIVSIILSLKLYLYQWYFLSIVSTIFSINSINNAFQQLNQCYFSEIVFVSQWYFGWSALWRWAIVFGTIIYQTDGPHGKSDQNGLAFTCFTNILMPLFLPHRLWPSEPAIAPSSKLSYCVWKWFCSFYGVSG